MQNFKPFVIRRTLNASPSTYMLYTIFPLVDQTVQKKVYTTLLLILDHAQQEGRVVDLSSIDLHLVTYDPKCLSPDFPEFSIEKAFNECEESIFYRHIVPRSVWKFHK